QALTLMLEIGAGILLIRVEEEIVDAAVDVVMALGVLLGNGLGVALIKASSRRAKALQRQHPFGRLREIDVACADHQRIKNRALGDDETAVGEAIADLGSRSIAGRKFLARSGFDLEIAHLDELGQEFAKQPTHRRLVSIAVFGCASMPGFAGGDN